MFDLETRTEINKIAERLRLDPAVLMAVAEVESGGKSFARINDRREPLIRFEGHYFYRMTAGKSRQAAQSAGLAHPRAGAVKNPRSQKLRWAMLHKAIGIDRPAALSSVSWGMGQVMGSHWNWLGYGSVEALVAEARRGAAGQVALMARFIDKAGLVKKLRKRDWAGFSRQYNGPGYRKNRYDTKLARAYARYANGTPISAPMANNDAPLKRGSRGPNVKELQRLLQNWGLRIRADGRFGKRTARQVLVAQKFHDQSPSGIVRSDFLLVLQKEAENWRLPKSRSTKPFKTRISVKSRGLNGIGVAISRLALFFWRRFF